jgi:hypothetical protein
MSELLDQVMEAYRTLKESRYLNYAVAEALPAGRCLMMAETEYNYSYVIFASLADAQKVAETFGMELRHISKLPFKLPPLGPITNLQY